MENRIGYAMNLNNIGIIYDIQGEYDRALDYYLRSLRIKESLGMKNSKDYAASLNNIGIVYYYKNKKDSVLYYFIRSLKIQEEIGDKAGIAASMNNIGELYSELQQFDNALGYLVKGLDISKEIGDKYVVMGTCDNLAKTYAHLNNHKAAYQYHQVFSTYKDSIFNEEKSKEIGALEEKYEWEKQERQRQYKEEELTKTAAIQKKRSDMLQVSGVFIVIVVLIFGLLLYASNLPINIHFIEGMVFVVFMMFFELTLVFLNPYIDMIADGKPIINLLANSVIAACLSPLHEILEGKMKMKITKDKKKRLERRIIGKQ
ncbi:MAG: signal transduction histidine kinase [Chitinophagaceae bacterium]|nr:MAG: signal transduction histidine kinase [Chitinophagaceae bacterium]